MMNMLIFIHKSMYPTFVCFIGENESLCVNNNFSSKSCQPSQVNGFQYLFPLQGNLGPSAPSLQGHVNSNKFGGLWP